MKKLARNVRRLVDHCRITDGKAFRLRDHDPEETAGLSLEDRATKEAAVEILQEGTLRLTELQNKLYAQDRWGVLVIFQAMDAAGKDSTIKHVMAGVNPQGVQVSSFKVPSPEELDHDFLWRATKCLPERGRIGIFNRSYYEEVLIVKVHPAILQGQKVPEELVGDKVWAQRYEDINAFERHLSHNGFLVLKFFLNVSKKEQRRRFLERLEQPDKNWKFSMADVEERAFWNDYRKAYEAAIAATSTRHAPWYVVPADRKWLTRIVVAEAIVSEMERLKLHYPKLDRKKREELAAARRALKNR